MSDDMKAQLTAVDGTPLTFQGMRLQGQLQGLLFEAEMEQAFVNPSEHAVEVVYTFPLPYGAVLLDVAVKLGTMELQGAIIGRRSAEREYEQALSEGDAAILLERNADGTHTLNLGNLAAREHCIIRLRYAQVLTFEQRGIRLLIPTVLAPRYGNPVTQGKLNPHQVPEHGLEVRYAFECAISIHGALAESCVSSPSHPVGIRHAASAAGSCVHVSLAGNACLDRDLVIHLTQLRVDSLALLGTDRGDSSHTATLLSFCPALPQPARADLAVKFLVDCSGSMSGDSIQSARRSLQAILTQLRDGDRFSLSKFGTTVSHRSRALWSVTAATRLTAQRWVNELDADMGGTEMEAALSSTFELSAPAESVVFLITDGQIYDVDNLLKTAARAGHRLFVIGIGSSPTEMNLRRLAEVSGGACDFVAPGETVEPAILRMFARLRSPRAESLQIQWPAGFQPLWSTPLPRAAFDADTIHVYALWPECPHGNVHLNATVEGSTDAVSLASLALPVSRSDDTTLSRMAAAHHLADLSDSEAESEALTYQLITPYTDFLLVHERAEDEKAHDMPELVKVKQMIPAGWGGVGSIDSGNVCYSVRSAEPTLKLVQQNVGEIDYSDMSPPHSYSAAHSRRESNMDLEYLDVPAFLRRQDDGMSAPVRESRCLDEQPMLLVQHLTATPKAHWPQSLLDLENLGIANDLIFALKFASRRGLCKGLSEAVILTSFFEALLSMPIFAEYHSLREPPARSVRHLIARLWPGRPIPGTHAGLVRHFQTLLQGVSERAWPSEFERALCDAA